MNTATAALCFLFAVLFVAHTHAVADFYLPSEIKNCNGAYAQNTGTTGIGCGCSALLPGDWFNSYCALDAAQIPSMSSSAYNEFNYTVAFVFGAPFRTTLGWSNAWPVSESSAQYTLPAGQTSITFSASSEVALFCDELACSYLQPTNGVNFAIYDVAQPLPANGEASRIYSGGSTPDYDPSDAGSSIGITFDTGNSPATQAPSYCGYFRVPPANHARTFRLLVLGRDRQKLVADGQANAFRWIGGLRGSGICSTDPAPLPTLAPPTTAPPPTCAPLSSAQVLAQCQAANICCDDFSCGVVYDACGNQYGCNVNPCPCTPWNSAQILAQCQAAGICCGPFSCGVVFDTCGNQHGCSANPCPCVPLSQAQACGSQCGVTVSNGCSGTIQCPACPTATGGSTPAPTTPTPTTTTPAPTTPAPTLPGNCYLNKFGIVRCVSSNGDSAIFVNPNNGRPLAVYALDTSLISANTSSGVSQNNPRASVSIKFSAGAAQPTRVSTTFPLSLPVYRPLLQLLQGKSNSTNVQFPLLIRPNATTTLLVNNTLDRIQETTSGILMADVYLNICDISSEVKNKKPKQGESSLDFLRRFPKATCPGVLIASYVPLLSEQSTQALAAQLSFAAGTEASTIAATTATTTRAASGASQQYGAAAAAMVVAALAAMF